MFQALVKTRSTPALASPKQFSRTEVVVAAQGSDENQGQAGSGIFDLTAANMPSARQQSAQQVKFPNITPKANKKPKTALGQARRPPTGTSSHDRLLRTAEIRPKSSWKNFVQRNFSREAPPSRSKAPQFIKQVHDDVEAEFDDRVGSPQALITNIKELEKSSNIKGQVGLLERHIAARKKAFNRLHHANQDLEERLATLTRQYDQLVTRHEDSGGLRSTLQSIKYQQEEVRNGIANEGYYEECLQYMIVQRRLAVSMQAGPINKLRNALNRCKKKLGEIQQDVYRANREKARAKQSSAACHTEIVELRQSREKANHQALGVYKDQLRFYNFFTKEKERDRDIEEQKRMAQKLLQEEQRIVAAKEEKMLNSELQNYERYIATREKNFQRIKQVSSCVSPMDMVPYFNYLQETRKDLESNADAIQGEIDTKRETLHALQQELEETQFSPDGPFGFDLHEFQTMELRFRDKNREIDQHEQILGKVQEVIAAAINSVTRLIFQLYSDYEKKQVGKTDEDGVAQSAANPGNVEAHLTVCGMKIERMLSILKEKKVVFYDESINTNKEVDSPPTYIKLNQIAYGGPQGVPMPTRGPTQASRVTNTSLLNQTDDERAMMEEIRQDMKRRNAKRRCN